METKINILKKMARTEIELKIMKNKKGFSISRVFPTIATNGMGICAVRPSKSIIKVRHLIKRIAYIPCYA